MFGTRGMTQARTCAGLIKWRPEPRFYARSGEPSGGASGSVAHLRAAATRVGFVTMTIATGGRDALEASGNISEECGGKQSENGRKEKAMEKTP
jgi:hypothetical protein